MTAGKSILARELRALRRVFFIYAPIFIAIYATLWGLGLFLEGRPVTTAAADTGAPGALPVVYSNEYNIGFMGLEKFHPFDSRKYARVYDILRAGPLKDRALITAGVPPHDIVTATHTSGYIADLRRPWTIARITELNFLRFLPAPLARALVLRPLLYQAGGTVQAAELAMHHGWAINLGGGFHHASADRGEGFCPYADIAMAVHALRRTHKHVRKVMIIDFDAHQGNGHERDFTGSDDVFIVDVYNHAIYPGDREAMKGIDLDRPIEPFTETASYLRTVDEALDTAFSSFTPDIVFYVAGSDILRGDPLGALNVDEAGLVERDERVFAAAFGREIPVVYLFGGGYQKSNAAIIARSLENLGREFGLFAQPR